MKDRRDKRPDAAGEEHIPELRNGRIGENLLDVVLSEADRRGKYCRRTADDRDDEHRRRCVLINCVAPHDHVNAGRDHRRRVDQCRDRRRAGHRVRQPCKKRYLCRFAGRPDKEQNRDRRDAAREYRFPTKRIGRHLGKDIQRTRDFGAVDRFVIERDRAGQSKNEKYTDQHAPVADAVHHKRFLGRTACLVDLEVVTDQQVRAQPDAFPADEHQQKIVRQHERQHREHEEVHVREKSDKSLCRRTYSRSQKCG